MAAPYSPSVTKNGFVFLSGQIHLKDGKLLVGSIEEQTHQVMKNLQRVLADEGLTFVNVVKVTIYTTDMSLYERVNKVYSEYFSENPPAREMIGVTALPLGARLEISMIATK